MPAIAAPATTSTSRGEVGEPAARTGGEGVQAAPLKSCSSQAALARRRMRRTWSPISPAGGSSVGSTNNPQTSTLSQSQD
jgi:hypothetical protein